MRLATLIALATKQRLDESPERLGMRLSPVTLSGAEVTEALKEARRVLGAKAFVVGSAPGVAEREVDPRAYLAPDHRAAERATAWRNRIDVNAGEHLLYVSAETHAKATGLRDCLDKLREQDLRSAFKTWAETSKSGLPPALVAALDEAGLLGQVRLAALCEFASKVAGAGAKGPAVWQVVADALPTINLAKDTRLGKVDMADRLRANFAMVRVIETAEGRRRTTSGPLASIEEALQTALASATGSTRRNALASVDFGAAKTGQLPKGKGTKPSAASVPPGKRASNTGKAKAGGSKRPGGGPTTPPDPKLTPLVLLPVEEPGSPGARVAGGGTPLPTPTPASTSTSAPKPAGRILRLLGPPLPKGLATLLTKILEGSGEAVEIRARDADRSHLRELAKTITPVLRPATRASTKLGPAMTRWTEARRALIIAARAGLETAPLFDILTRGISSLLKEPGFETVVGSFVDATIALFEVAGAVDEQTMREVLTLDTCAVRASGGEVALRVVGPLHLLSLGQALVAIRALDATKDLPENSRRLVARSLEAAPAAPGVFPEDSGELTLARSVGGLLVYERVPELVSAADAIAAARAVVGRYLALCPHAALGLRVAVDGEGDLAPLIEGVATAVLEATPRPDSVEVLCPHPPYHEARSLTARAIEEGFLRLGSPDADMLKNAHIVLRFAQVARRPEDEEATSPAVKTFAPPTGGRGTRTSFDLRARGLRVRTSVASSRELAAVEALTARATGLIPTGAFVTEVTGRSLRTECEGLVLDGGWLAVVGPSIGRRPPLPWRLLAHEQVGARTTCAVVARELRPAVRALGDALSAMGINEMRPRSLLLLAQQLADAGRSALVPLAGPPARLVATGLLAIELRKALGGESEILVAPITGAVCETLVGTEDETEAGSLVLAAQRAGDGLRLMIGYASTAAALDFDVSKSNFEGGVAKRLARIADAVNLMATSKREDGAAALEAISWALWSSAAADEVVTSGWREALDAWSGSVATPVEAVALVPPTVAGNRAHGGKIGRLKTTVVPLMLDRLNAMVLGVR